MPRKTTSSSQDVDSLQSTVVGGLHRTSISTGAVLGGFEEADALLAKFGPKMTPPQLAAVTDLLSALRSA